MITIHFHDKSENLVKSRPFYIFTRFNVNFLIKISAFWSTKNTFLFSFIKKKKKTAAKNGKHRVEIFFRQINLQLFNKTLL